MEPEDRRGGDHAPAGRRGVAVWFRAGGSIVGERYDLDGPQAVVNGRYIEPAPGHAEAWERCRPEGAEGGCGGVPRGTVAFDCMLHKFVVRGPRALVDDDAFRSEVKAFFGLPPVVLFEAAEPSGP